MSKMPSNNFIRALLTAAVATIAILTASVVFALTPTGAPPPLSASTDSDADLPSASLNDVHVDPNASVEELLASGREMSAQKSYDLAEMLYKGALVKDPNSVDAMVELSSVYEATGKFEYARGLLERAAKIKPDDPQIKKRMTGVVARMSESLTAEIDELLAKKKYEAALPKVSGLLALEPNDPELHYQKALCHMNLGQPRTALAAINVALAIQKDIVYYDLRDKAQQAVKDNEVHALKKEAKKLIKTEAPANEEGAMQIIGRILDIDPDNPWAKDEFRKLGALMSKRAKKAAGDPRWEYYQAETMRLLRGAGAVSLSALESLPRHREMLILILLALIVLNSPLTRVLVRGFSPRYPLTGRLRKFSMTEILSLIHQQQGSGILRIRAKSAKGDIYFNRGEIYHCKSGRIEGNKALQRLLKNSSDGFFLFSDGAVATRKTIDTPLSLMLTDLPARRQAINAESNLRRYQSRIKSMLDSHS